ncbi:MAG: phytanoyl-CoA dioxygenase family protein [Phycisphaeraceae bacterium]
MSLSDEQVEQFCRHGYTLVPEFFSPREVQAMQAEVRRFQRDGLLRNVSTEGDGQTRAQDRQNLQLCPMHPHSDFFRSLPFSETVISAVRRLIGDPVLLHLDQIFVKPAQHGAGTNWHQDNAYFKIDRPLMGTAMWIAVHDATVENGTIEVIPDVYDQSLDHERDPMSDHHIRCYPDESKAVPCVLPAGGVAFFCYGTPHCTRANRSDRERAGVAYHFINATVQGQARAGYAAGLRPHLTGEQATGGEGEFGTRVAGTWPDEVERALAADAQAADAPGAA